jgi:hypothetical protein
VEKYGTGYKGFTNTIMNFVKEFKNTKSLER